MRYLSCGCQACGCMCEMHAPRRVETPCRLHRLAGSVASAVSILLFMACAFVWGAVLLG